MECRKPDSFTLQDVAGHDTIRRITLRASPQRPYYVQVGYRNAEVVELADTPSDAITLAILHKLLILQLLSFASITSNEPPKEDQ